MDFIIFVTILDFSSLPAASWYGFVYMLQRTLNRLFPIDSKHSLDLPHSTLYSDGVKSNGNGVFTLLGPLLFLIFPFEVDDVEAEDVELENEGRRFGNEGNGTALKFIRLRPEKLLVNFIVAVVEGDDFMRLHNIQLDLDGN